MKTRIIFATLLAFSATTAFAVNNIDSLKDGTRAAAMPFMKALAEENKKAVQEGGPESAVKVCKDIAPKMASELSRQKGWKVTRVSMKVRNPMLGTTDEWEQKALKKMEARLAKGEKPETLEVAEIVKGADGKTFRYMKGIVLQPGCVSCHGKSEEISEAVKASLAVEYPHDQATGYAPGQLRGGLSIQRKL
ncbi:MAG: hypothetical protein FD121_51 [Gallionellaceae bacterium]|nr:MAG: hypothetical protein FD121_51 [Gallionellaceae bacterium]